MTEAFLRRRFEIIRDSGYLVLPLGESVVRLRGGTLPSRSVVITFDDGAYNFVAAAAPLLEEFGFPATIYMSTYHCIHQRPILSLTLSYLLWCARLKALDSNVFIGLKYPIALNDDGQIEKLEAELLTEARDLSNDRDDQQDGWVNLRYTKNIEAMSNEIHRYLNFHEMLSTKKWRIKSYRLLRHDE